MCLMYLMLWVMNRFQFVATKSGALRVFPGIEWAIHDDDVFLSSNGLGSDVENLESWDKSENSDKYALFDPRLTAWFSSSVSGAKDVILLLDITRFSSE